MNKEINSIILFVYIYVYVTVLASCFSNYVYIIGIRKQTKRKHIF